jgi:hypothetical protein
VKRDRCCVVLLLMQAVTQELVHAATADSAAAPSAQSSSLAPAPDSAIRGSQDGIRFVQQLRELRKAFDDKLAAADADKVRTTALLCCREACACLGARLLHYCGQLSQRWWSGCRCSAPSFSV